MPDIRELTLYAGIRAIAKTRRAGFCFQESDCFARREENLFESLHRAYEPYEVNAGNVIEIWKFHSYFFKDVPERISEVQHISTAVNEILQRLKVIEEKIEG